MSEPTYKTCTTCGEEKPMGEFRFRSYTRKGDGGRARYAYCRACAYAANVAWKNTSTGRASNRAAQQRYRNSPRGKASCRVRWLSEVAKRECREYYAAHREQCRAVQSLYSKSEAGKATYAKGLSKHLVRQQTRRTQKRDNGGGGVTHAEWQTILRRYNHRCGYCGDTEQITMDHVMPLSKGGQHDVANVAPACRPCNARKHTATNWVPRVFLEDVKLCEVG